MIRNRPQRLGILYLRQPLYFVTFCTRDRRKISSLDRPQAALEKYGLRAREKFNVALGRYVIMPDHVHLFVRGSPEFPLSRWVGGLKRAMSVAVFGSGRDVGCNSSSRQVWQPGFFDHILRSEESYTQKWEYVRQNPVRAGLVDHAEDWPYQGEIVYIDRA